MKKITLIRLARIITVSLFSCQTGGPADDVLLSRFSELIPAAAEINDIFFGEGLPVYSREEYPEAYQMTVGADPDYDFITLEAKYQSIEDIKAAAEAVYTTDYLMGIYGLVFDGFYDANIGHIAARYTQDSNGFSKHNKIEPQISGAREYDMNSAKILMKNDSYATIEVNSTYEGESSSVRIRMKNQDGIWLLDDPSY